MRLHQSSPFFLWVAPKSPHQEEGKPYPIPAMRDIDIFKHQPFPDSPNFNELDVSDKPGIITDLPLMDAHAIDKTKTYYRKYLDTMLAVEDLVQGIVAELKS